MKSAKKVIALTLAALTLGASCAFAAKNTAKVDEIYDRYAAENPAQMGPAAFQSDHVFAVLVGSKAEYLDRQQLFFSIIEDEMNDGRRTNDPLIVCDASVQKQWIDYCNSTLHTGEHILKDDELVAFSAKINAPIIYVYPTEDVNFSVKKVYDDGRLVDKHYAAQRFVAILADNGKIARRVDFTAEGDSKKSRDRALVDAFEEGVDQATHLLFRRR